MATEVIMPKVDMVMETGTFVEWLKQDGDEVRKGDPLFVILTDKANIEVEAPGSGILAGLKAQPDDVIPVTEIIAYILEPGEALPAERPVSPDPDSTAKDPSNDSEAGASAPAIAGIGPGVSHKKVRATPAARRLAAELGLDLASILGTGPNGRVHKANVLASAGQQTAAPAVAAAKLAQVTPGQVAMKPPQDIPLPVARQKEVLSLTGPRKIIAERLVHSAFTAPHINLSLRIDMTEATRLRNRVKAQIEQKTGRRLSFTAIVTRAVASVIPSHPYLNASVQGDQIFVWEDVHLGIATSLEDQLIVPVIREAQTKNLEQIVTELSELVERARANRLMPAEMSGSTFTISNLGMFGIESFTAIINPPESAILAVGAIVDTPVRTDGEPEFRPLMNVTVSADHRVVDGAAVAHFLAELKATLENPYLLI